MKLPARLHYFFSPPPLWIIQIGRDRLIFSRVKNDVIGEQEQLYLETNTLLLNKIANPSSLCRGLRLFCKQKKLAAIRAWILLPKEFYPLPLLAHELFQFLVCTKDTPIIPQAVMTNPFEPTQLSTNALHKLAQSDNYLSMFDRYSKIHPAWLICGIAAISISAGFLTSRMTANTYQHTTKRQEPLREIKLSPTARLQTQIPTTKKSWPTIDNSLTMLLNIAHNIPPSIVLEKISTKKATTRSKAPPITTAIGITYNLHDLLEFVTILEQEARQRCYLSYIKEQPMPKSSPDVEDSRFALYRFSLTIDL